jgi:hypothetical protein
VIAGNILKTSEIYDAHLGCIGIIWIAEIKDKQGFHSRIPVFIFIIPNNPSSVSITENSSQSHIKIFSLKANFFATFGVEYRIKTGITDVSRSHLNHAVIHFVITYSQRFTTSVGTRRAT